MLEPLKMHPVYKEPIWGGKNLREKYGKDIPSDTTGEAWEVAAHKNGQSTVAGGALDGKTLGEAIELLGKDLLGDYVAQKYPDKFPLLVKFLDCNDKLSVQVHPDDATAKERHNAYGKTEMWYLVDADPEARLLLGFNKDTDKSEYLTKLHNNTLPEILNVEKVKKGDCFFIPAGTVHAIEKGCFIAEIQQTSDITYRIYDYDRRDKNGNARELHTELATDVIHFNSQKEHSIPYHRHENHTEELVDCNYFTTSYLKFDKEIEKDYIDIDSFVIYMCLDGNFTIVYDTDQSIQVKKGETILVPACLKNIFLIPQQEAELLEIFIR